MDLFTILGAMFRRWYITLPLLLLVLFFSYRSYAAVEPLYMSSRSIVVLPSLAEEAADPAEDAAASAAEVDNPYSGQGGSRFAVAVLTRNINSTAFEEGLGLEPGLEQSFEASSSSQQPMIHIEATAASPEAVYDLLDRIVDDSTDVLDSFQAEAGAPEVTRYRIAPAVPAGPVEDVTPSRLRGAGAIAVLGSALTAALVVGGDALLAARLRRRQAEAEREGVGGSGPADEDAVDDDASTSDDGRRPVRTDEARSGRPRRRTEPSDPVSAAPKD